MADDSELEAVRAAKRELAERLRGRGGVSGIGVGRADNGRYAVQVLLTYEGAGGVLPTQLHGIEVTSRVIGAVRAH